MRRIEFTADDQHIAKVCDPARPGRYEFVYHTPSEKWLTARLLPGEAGRFAEALKAQGCEIVIQNYSEHEWNSIKWLRHYRPDAPIDAISRALRAAKD